MAISLERLCEKADYLYGMRVLAGESSMHRPVQWVHTIEERDVADFLQGGELIFTTGITFSGVSWMKSFVAQLWQKKAAGLVVNTGQYITDVPEEVRAYCNQLGFPLLEVPWRTRLVEITRDFCNQIIEEERKSDKISVMFGDMVRGIKKEESIREVSELYGIDRAANYQVIVLSCECGREQIEIIRSALRELECYLEKRKCRLSIIEDKKCITIIFYGYKAEKRQEIIDEAERFLSGKLPEETHVGIGCGVDNISKLDGEYYRTMKINKLAVKRGVARMCFDELQSERLFLSYRDGDILDKYYQNILGELQQNDERNGSGYIELLYKYLECDGSIAKMAEKTGVHRNTINYQMNKMKKILGNEMSTLDERFQVILALKIKEVL